MSFDITTFRVITRGTLAIIGISACFTTTLVLRLVVICGQTILRWLLLLSDSVYLSRLLARLSEHSYGWTVFWVHFYSKIFCQILAIKPRFFEFIDTSNSALRSGNKSGENTEELRPCTPHELKRRVIKLQKNNPGAKILLQANHISIIDIFLIGSTLKTSFIAKHDVKTWPVVGWMTSMVGVMFVHRESMSDRYQAIFRLKQKLTSTAVCVFPEATTTDHDTPRLNLWQSGNLYSVRSSSKSHKESIGRDTPGYVVGYVVALSVSYQDRHNNSWTGDLSFVALIMRILRRKQTDVSLIWSLMSYDELAGSTLRARSLSVFLRIWKQCQLGSELPPP